MSNRTGAAPVYFTTVDDDTLELRVDPDAATGLIDFITTTSDEDGWVRVALIQVGTSNIDKIIETLQNMKTIADQP